jgi:sterol desaturase/sphingolipid hydroxylase (fatty acid hydroxylase superfamily)
MEKVIGVALWGASFRVWDAGSWQPWQYAAWAVVIMAGLELMALLVDRVPPLLLSARRIPQRGKHLDTLGTVDWAFICWNKFTTSVFTYHAIRYCWLSPSIKWSLDDTTPLNTVVAFPALFVVYDLFYSLWHRFLHLRQFYKYIHKHHHHQAAPTRGNVDAVNVHPVEFIVGEYLHLLAIAIVPCHVITAALFVVIGGVLASLNHTRYDVVAGALFDVKAHDEHHVIPTVNYGQYIMLWDHIFGTYRAHPGMDCPMDEKKAAPLKFQ